MTISEIKDLAKLLNEEEVDKIKEEIRSKENILKGGNLDEGEMTEVLNTLFSILVIEKALETEIEGIEEMRADLEEELREAYEIYDTYMVEHKKQSKKKKKRWLLDFLFLSDKINNRRTAIGNTDKRINALKSELNQLKEQRSDENLRKVCNDPRHHHDQFCDISKKGDNRLARDLNGNGIPDIYERRHHHGKNPRKEKIKEMEQNQEKDVGFPDLGKKAHHRQSRL